MISAASHLTSLNPLGYADPYQLVMMNLFTFATQAFAIGVAAASLVLILMSIDIVGSSTKPTRVEQLAEAPLLSVRGWVVIGYLVGVPVFALSLATQIVSAVTKMDPVMSFYTILMWIVAALGAIVLIAIAFESVWNAVADSRESRRERVSLMTPSE